MKKNYSEENNKYTQLDPYPLPKTDKMVNTVAKDKYTLQSIYSYHITKYLYQKKMNHIPL